jgi:hypothetical protein
VVGAIMLWLSRVWTAGEKLIGMTLSGVSLIWAGILGFDLQITDPGAGLAGARAGGVAARAFPRGANGAGHPRGRLPGEKAEVPIG